MTGKHRPDTYEAYELGEVVVLCFGDVHDGRRSAVTFVDYDDWDWLRGTEIFLMRNYPAVQIDQKRFVNLSRYIAMHYTKVATDEQIDHKNHDKHDNRKQNLQIVNPSQNSMKSAVENGDEDLYVTERGEHSFVVRYTEDGRQIYVGTYKTREEARKVAEKIRKNIIEPYIKGRDII